MSNNWLENNVTSLEDSKRLVENNIDLEADGYWVEHTLGLPTFVPVAEYNELHRQNPTSCVVYVKAYRLDRLLAELPEPHQDYDGLNFDFLTDDCGGKSNKHAGLDWETESHIRSLAGEAFLSKGQEAIKACVSLLVLLAEHDLLILLKESDERSATVKKENKE